MTNLSFNVCNTVVDTANKQTNIISTGQKHDSRCKENQFSSMPSLSKTKPRYSPSANQRPKACSAPRVLPGFSIIGSNWLLHMAVLLCTVIGRVDLVEPWLHS